MWIVQAAQQFNKCGFAAAIFALSLIHISTLLKIMAGLEETDEGTVTKANHAVIAYLPQHPIFDPEMTALDCVLAGHRELSGPESRQAEKRDHQDEAALVTKAKTCLLYTSFRSLLLHRERGKAGRGSG